MIAIQNDYLERDDEIQVANATMAVDQLQGHQQSIVEPNRKYWKKTINLSILFLIKQFKKIRKLNNRAHREWRRESAVELTQHPFHPDSVHHHENATAHINRLHFAESTEVSATDVSS